MGKLFKLKENGTNVRTEIIAGLTTFFTMAYIIFVNQEILGKVIVGADGEPLSQAITLATIFAAVAGTLVMGLFANVPYAQAPGMGLNAFFTFTVCMGLQFKWQEALAMVFICGIINILITVTKVRKWIIKSIPESLQNAIGGGIGIFIAYIGIKSAGWLDFSSGTPELVDFKTAGVLLAVIGLVIIVGLLLFKVKGAILLGIIITTIIGIPMKVVNLSDLNLPNLSDSFAQLGQTFGAAFGSPGIQSLFSTASRIPLVLVTIFAFSITDTFDTIGTFIGTGRRTGIFSAEDMQTLESNPGFKSKMDRALFADSIATSVGAVFGTSNTTTYVESAAGIGEGGRTGLTSVVTALLFILSIFITPYIGIVPSEATAPALIIVGIMMLASFRDINWKELEDAIPAFFAGIFMALCYSISYGIGTAFIFYCIVKACKGKFREIHPILLVSAVLFLINFALLAITT
jgi:AGZA family xanthine/uracil permease-like MFS transporter